MSKKYVFRSSFAALVLIFALSGCLCPAPDSENELVAENELMAENELVAGEESGAGEDACPKSGEQLLAAGAMLLAKEASPRIAVTDLSWIDSVIDSEGIYLVSANGTFTYWTEDGERITPYVYQDASPFYQGLACVCVNGKYGYIDADGEVALDFIYDYATPFVEDMAYFVVGRSYGFMNRAGEVLFLLFCDSVSSFQEGRAYFSMDGQYGYLDAEGNVAIEAAFDDAGYFRQGFAIVRKGGSYGLIDPSGEPVIPIAYEHLDYEEKERTVIARKDGMDHCFVPDGDGTWKEVLCKESVSVLSGGDNDNTDPTDPAIYFCFQEEGGTWGLSDRSGNVLIPAEYDNLRLVSWADLVIAAKDGEQGALGLDGEVKIPLGVYDRIYEDSCQEEVFLYVEKDHKEGCLDGLSLKEVIPPAQYREISDFKGRDCTVVSEGNRYGVIDRFGNLIYPLEYDRIWMFDDGSMGMVKDGVCELHNPQGETIYRGNGTTVRGITKHGGCYEIETADHKIIFLDSEGMRLTTERYDYTRIVQRDPNLLVAGTYGNAETILRMGEPKESVLEVEGAILKNAVTPREWEFYKVFLEIQTEKRSHNVTEGGSNLFRFYRVDNDRTVVLLHSKSPYYYAGFPLSESAFYVRDYEEYTTPVVNGLSAYQCGGSARGNYAVLWYDLETDRVLPGDSFSAGGFAGLSYGGTIYRPAYFWEAEEEGSVLVPENSFYMFSPQRSCRKC